MLRRALETAARPLPIWVNRNSRRRPMPRRSTAAQGVSQGCSVLRSGETVGEETVEAEGVGVDGLAHVADPVRPQDVERERAQPGEDAGLAPDAAVVLAQHAVPHMVVPVLDAPVRPD